jgi:hypothetical protein
MKLFLIALLLGSVFGVSSSAHAADNAVCTVSGPLTLKPGLTMTSGRTTYSSHGPTGTIDCHGSAKGRQITGAGTLTNRGVITGSCAQSTGSGRLVARIPTDAGTLRVSGKYTFQTVGAAGPFSGSVFSGTFEFLADAGDCVSSPLTRVTVLAQGAFTT